MTFEKEAADQFLFVQMKLGKEDAFNFIFRKYYKGLSLRALKIIRDEDTAQSIVQDCFVKFWEKRLELSNIGDIHSYLFFMVRNKCIDHLRSQKRQLQIPIGEYLEYSKNDVFEEIDAKDLSAHLWQAISHLPERCRLAFEYSRIDGYPYSKIAHTMGISEKAVEALISRSLKILRFRLIDFLSLFVFLFS